MMKYRVGDIVYDLNGTSGRGRSKATVISATPYGRYEVKHHYTGFESFAGRSSKELELIKRASEMECGDLVMVKKTRQVGQITATTTEAGGKLTRAVVKGAGEFLRPHTQLKLLRREGEEKEVGTFNGKRVIITRNMSGKYRHGFNNGDTCRVEDYMSMLGQAVYLLKRESDGFEQNVEARCFEEIEDTANIVEAGEIIDMVYSEPGAEIKFEEGYKSDWFPILLRRDFPLYGRMYEKGHEFSAREVFHKGELKTEVRFTAMKYKFVSETEFEYMFIKKEDAGDMGAELYGYPPEEDTQAVAKVDEEKKAMEAQIAELRAETERLRKENVEKEFGVVEKNHLWSVTILIPARSKYMPKGFGSSPTEKTTEVVTEGQSAVEAAMVAEGMAKGISEEAVVLSVVYQRVLGAIK